MAMKVICNLSFPVIFIMDRENENLKIPEVDGEAVVSSNSTCIALRTISYVDGDVMIDLDDENENSSLEEKRLVFKGKLEVPNKKVAVVTAEDEKLLEIKVNESAIVLRVSVDNKEYPEKIWISAAKPKLCDA